MKVELYNDNVGYVESFDFSRANMSKKSRIDYVQRIASICYKSPVRLFDEETGKGGALYNRLFRESLGLPSSSFELIPILLTKEQIKQIQNKLQVIVMERMLNVEKYGEWVTSDTGEEYLLTNLRALIADIGDNVDQFYNTDEKDITLIKKHFKVFKSKIPLFIARQFMRHRVQWQEMSRRYVSGKKQEFEFYMSPKLDNSTIKLHYKSCVQQYNKATEQGVLPQDARQVLPQSMYTEMYSAWYPSQLQSMLDLRTAESTQVEMRELAKGIKTLVNKV